MHPALSLPEVRNYIGGAWRTPRAREWGEVHDPATGRLLGRVPLAAVGDVAAAVEAAASAFSAWRATPVGERVQYLFRLKKLLEDNLEELARIITIENGKTLAEARAELRRGIENVETACGAPMLMQGYNLEDVAAGVDEIMIRQPLGVAVAITPFNFPAMIPLWFLPYAVACGNTFVLKPSERVPFTMQKVIELIEQSGLPPGVVNLVHGGRQIAEALIDHPQVRAISFVGSTAAARQVYARAAASGKRVQCQAGAKNHVVILPDAEMETATQVISDSAFGCAGQRCLAVSVAVTVGEIHDRFRDSIAARAVSLRVGCGLEEGVEMGPVISRESQRRIEALISEGLREGARGIVDGRGARVPGYQGGCFVRPTVLENVPIDSPLTSTEIFGPVLSLTRARDLDEAIRIIAANPYGNAASIFTTSGLAARRFRYEVPAGNIGVNVGVAAPMAWFPFSGWKDSFLGTLHGQGRDAIEFYTERKVVIERWPKQWTRRF